MSSENIYSNEALLCYTFFVVRFACSGAETGFNLDIGSCFVQNKSKKVQFSSAIVSLWGLYQSISFTHNNKDAAFRRLLLFQYYLG